MDKVDDYFKLHFILQQLLDNDSQAVNSLNIQTGEHINFKSELHKFLLQISDVSFPFPLSSPHPAQRRVV